jgi:hypothetical protein
MSPQKEGTKMWYAILGYLLISGLCAILFWFALIVAKRSDKSSPLDCSKQEAKEKQ